MIKIIKFLNAYVKLRGSLYLKKKRYVLAFDLASIGESQFFMPILAQYLERNPQDIVIMVHHANVQSDFNKLFPNFAERVMHVHNKVIRLLFVPEIDLFLATEQYSLGINGIYSIALFHGQPSKGLTFNEQIINSFDAFFLYGPLHRQALCEFLIDNRIRLPDHLELFDVGYPKSDLLINGHFSAQDVIDELNLDPSKKTILYAPAFNEGASLRENGLKIIKLLALQSDYNAIVKLPIDCYAPISNYYATGGIDWFKEIQKLEAEYSHNLRLYTDYSIDPLLSCADVPITCVSSVSFEFLALNKPVIFIDTPRFFSKYLEQQFPDKDTISWSRRTTVNGGREFGIIVTDVEELPQAVKSVLKNSHEFPYQQERLKSYLLYNKGRSTEVAVEKIEQLLRANVKSRRLIPKRGLIQTCISAYLKESVQRSKGRLRSSIKRALNSFGYSIQPIGEGYYDPAILTKAAENAHLSICDYLESRETDPRKRGRRNRIITQIDQRHLFNNCDVVLEIGAGTGMYMEKVLECGKPRYYEVYEANLGWIQYLKANYSCKSNCKIVLRCTDGETLKHTPSAYCQLVHAHGVFVYIPILKVFSYLDESARVLAPGGHLVFDCLLDDNFGIPEIRVWLSTEWRFPVILPSNTLMEYARKIGLVLHDRFREIYGPSYVDYLIFKKV